MKKLIGPVLLSLLIMMLVALVAGSASIAEDSGGGSGQAAFLAQKCDTCHSVPSAAIVSKTESEKMKGPDLPTASLAKADRAALLLYVRKEGEFEGKTHKKGATATDEELNTILDWIVAQPVAATK